MAEPTLKAHQIDYSKFIYFHPNANGANGRPVYIDPELIVRFMELIDVSDKSGRTLAGKIVDKLSSVAGGVTSDSNASNAAQHRDHFVQENVSVTYTILQHGGLGAGVYITHMEHAVRSERGNGPGQYKVDFSSRRAIPWKAEEDSAKTMPTMLGAVGALAPTSGCEVSADATAGFFGQYLVGKDAKHLGNAYTLFYTPAYVIDGFGVWIGSENKTAKDRGSPQALANLILNTESDWNTTGCHRWYVFEEGVKQLMSALQLCKGRVNSFEHHEFKFVTPKVPLGQLQSILKQVGIELTKDMLIHDVPNVATKTRLMVDPSNTYLNFHTSFEASAAMQRVQDTVMGHYDRRLQNVYFVDIVKGLVGDLSPKEQ